MSLTQREDERFGPLAARLARGARGARGERTGPLAPPRAGGDDAGTARGGGPPAGSKAGGWARLAPVVTVAGALGLWEGLGRTSLASTLPPFSTVADWLVRAAVTGPFWGGVGHTMLQWLLGLLAGGVLGVVIGLAIGFSNVVRILLDVVVEFLRPIPAIVYLPLLILFYGNTDTLSVINVSAGVVFIMLFQTHYGVRDIDPLVIDTGRVYGLTRRQRLVRLVLPSIAPYLATGIRIACSTAFLIAVSVELIGGSPGLGLSIGYAQSNGQYAAMYGYVVVTGLLAVAVNSLLVRVERAVIGRRSPSRAAGAR